MLLLVFEKQKVAPQNMRLLTWCCPPTRRIFFHPRFVIDVITFPFHIKVNALRLSPTVMSTERCRIRRTYYDLQHWPIIDKLAKSVIGRTYENTFWSHACVMSVFLKVSRPKSIRCEGNIAL